MTAATPELRAQSQGLLTAAQEGLRAMLRNEHRELGDLESVSLQTALGAGIATLALAHEAGHAHELIGKLYRDLHAIQGRVERTRGIVRDMLDARVGTWQQGHVEALRADLMAIERELRDCALAASGVEVDRLGPELTS